MVTRNSDEPLYYPFTVSVKVFNLMSRVNETRFLVQHDSCGCKCGLNESVCYPKQKCNHNECPVVSVKN